MYNILEKVFFGDTLVLKFRNIQFWNDLIIGGVKYMYEQDYIIRMNNEVIRTMVKLLLNKDIGTPVDISDGAIKGENKKMIEILDKLSFKRNKDEKNINRKFRRNRFSY